MKKITVYWCSKTTKERIYEIRRWFNLPTYATVNGETPCEIEEDKMDELKAFEEQGFIQIRNK